VGIIVAVGTNGVPVGIDVAVIAIGWVSTVKVAVAVTSKGKEGVCRMRANKEPISTAATRLAMRSNMRIMLANGMIEYVLSESPNFSHSSK